SCWRSGHLPETAVARGPAAADARGMDGLSEVDARAADQRTSDVFPDGYGLSRVQAGRSRFARGAGGHEGDVAGAIRNRRARRSVQRRHTSRTRDGRDVSELVRSVSAGVDSHRDASVVEKAVS